MADIFISYKKEDAGRVIRIVEGLREAGFTVWWDHGITPGAQWDQAIQQELTLAKAVVAIWSNDSINAPWVKEEAAIGKNRGILLPIRIDDVAPPLGFSLIQMGDLVGWDGKRDDAHWVQVVDALKAIIRGDKPKGLEAAPRRRRGGSLVFSGVALGLMALLAIGVVVWQGMHPNKPDVVDNSAAQTQVSAPPAAGLQTGAAPSAQETEAWERAMSEKTRAAYQAFLVSFPNSAKAQQARDILLTCRSQSHEVWAPQRTGQVLRGVNTDLSPTQDGACALARRAANAVGERTCLAMVANNPNNARNQQSSMVEAPCECHETPGGWYCSTDPAFTCTWEMRSEQQSEVCGG